MEAERKKPGYQTRTKNVAGKIRSAGTEQEPVIEAYFSVFGDKYEFSPGCYETIDPAAFDGQLSGDVRALADHDSRLVLGRTTAGTLELRADSVGLWGRIKINPEDSEAMNVYSRVKRGDVSNCSFGFEILKERKEEDPDGSWHWIVERVKLWEVSVVTFPAYEDTVATARSCENKEFKRRKVEALKAKWAHIGKTTEEREALKQEARRKEEEAKQAREVKEVKEVMGYEQRTIYSKLASSRLVREFFTEKEGFGEFPDDLTMALDMELGKLSPLYKKVRALKVNYEARFMVVTLKRLEDPSLAWIDCSGSAFPEAEPNEGSFEAKKVDSWNVGAYGYACSQIMRDLSDAAIQMYIMGLARNLVPVFEEAILNGDGFHKPSGILPALSDENKKTTEKTGAELYGDLIDFASLANPELYAGPFEFSAIGNRKTLMRLLNTIGSTETQSPAFLPQLMAEITPCETMKDGELLLGYLPTYALFVRKPLGVQTSEHFKYIEDQTAVLVKGRYDGKPLVKTAFVYVKMTALGAK